MGRGHHQDLHDQRARSAIRRRVTERSPWIVRLAVVIAVLPGIPTAVVYAAAGWTRMRLATFLLLDLVGAVLMTAVVAGLGYSLGQRAVDVVLTIDRYASMVSLTMISVATADTRDEAVDPAQPVLAKGPPRDR